MKKNDYNNLNNKNISKKELFDKLTRLTSTQLMNIGLNSNGISYLKNKILNDKLGLVLNFEEKDEFLDNHYFGLEEVKELHINPKDKNNHLLIEGDNYYALKAIQVSGVKVDVIYIDPPYNTGNKDFVYNDSFVEKDDQYKHSKWLSFMKKRLTLAKELLADDGVIFVSIDDNEQAYLKVLMDEIFGEENFITNFVWQKKSGGGQAKYIYEGHEYISLYAKQKNNLNGKLGVLTNRENREIKIDEKGNKYYLETDYIRKEFGKKSKSTNHRNCFYEELAEWKDQETIDDIENKLKTKELELVWYEKLKMHFIAKRMYLINNKYVWTIPYSLIQGIWTADGNNELESIFNGHFFDNPKPTSIIKIFLNMNKKKNSIILDFFAGSGTTAQAVMELNEEDCGNRRFILCTNNENNIAQDICRERIYRVINGEGTKKQKIDWEYSKDKKSLNNNTMKYLKVKPIHSVDGKYEEINDMKDLYKNEFDKELSLKDFK